MEHITYTSIGLSATATTTAVSSQIPFDSAQRMPRFIRVSATAPCYVKVGVYGIAAAVGDLMVQPFDAVTLCVAGCSTISYRSLSGTASINIVPTEDGPCDYFDAYNFSPLSLFNYNTQGVWYDPSDFSTMFQDSAGTTPVTAVEQPVGKILDKSGRGNHAIQATSTKRPILRQDAFGKYYLAFDGIDDALSTGSIDFTGTDKMTVFAGVRKLSDATEGSIVELSASYSANVGTFGVSTSYPANPRYITGLRGTNVAAYANEVFTAPITNVVSVSYDIAGAAIADEIKSRVNGNIPSLTSIVAASAGTGNFGNWPIYIGSRGGTTLPFNGNLYSLIVRGAQSTDAQITSAESYVNSKTSAY